MLTALQITVEIEHYVSDQTAREALRSAIEHSTAREAIATALAESLGDDFDDVDISPNFT
jgi:hypothetical protein